MPFTPTNLFELNPNIVIKPIYGWGWSIISPDEDLNFPLEHSKIEEAGYILVEVITTIIEDDLATGAYGKLSWSNAPFNNWYIYFRNRLEGEHDLEKNLPTLDLELSKSEPLWAPQRPPKEVTYVIGAGYVGLNANIIENWLRDLRTNF